MIAAFSRIRLLAAIVATTFAPFSTAHAAPPAPVPYSIVTSRHFVKNDVPLGARTFFLIRDYATFDSIFGYGAVMGVVEPPVSASDFKAHMMLVAVAHGPLCTLTVTGVSASGPNYTVTYTAKCESRPTSGVYSVPVIVSVPQAPVAGVTFIENGKTAGSVRRASKPLPAPKPDRV